MQYVGIDWAYRHARWCAISEHGELVAEATTPADEDGLLRLVARLGPDIKACVEMMSGAVWVRDRTPPLDLLGAGLSIVSLASIVFTLIEGVDAGWTSPEVLSPAVVGVAAGMVFVRVELRRRHPLFDVRVLARPAVIAGAVAIVSMYIAFLGVLFLLP